MEVKGKVAKTYQNLKPLDLRIVEGLDETILSVSKITDTGSVAVFDKDKVRIYDSRGFNVNTHANIFAEGTRDKDGLYRINADNESDIASFIEDAEKCFKMKSMNSYYSNTKLDSDAEIARFFHATFGYPTISTMHAALKRHLVIPGLDHKIFIDNAPRSIFTARGHLHNLPQGTNSTKPKRSLVSPTQKEVDAISAKYDMPRILSPGYRMDLDPSSDLAQTAWYVKLSQRLTMDGTGNMTVPAFNGDTQILIVFHAATNFIRTLAFKSKAEVHSLLIELWKEAKGLGHTISEIRMDNELPESTSEYFKSQQVAVQRVGVGRELHRANSAERAIQTYKDHFMSTIAARDPQCPLQYWTEAVPFCERTLNLMRPGPDNISAFQAYWGYKYDFNAHPIAPWGTRVETYTPRELRTTFESRSEAAWYMGPSKAHHRGHRIICDVYNQKPTVVVREQLVFYPHDVPFIKWTATEDMRQRIKDLAEAIKKVGKTTIRSTNVAEELQTYAKTFIAPIDKDKPISLFATGNGVVHWEGSQFIDDSNGEVLIQLNKDDGSQTITDAGKKHPLLKEDEPLSEGEEDSQSDEDDDDVSEGVNDDLSEHDDPSEGEWIQVESKKAKTTKSQQVREPKRVKAAPAEKQQKPNPIARGNMITRKRHGQDGSEVVAAQDIVRGKIRFSNDEVVLDDQNDEVETDEESSEGAEPDVTTSIMTVRDLIEDTHGKYSVFDKNGARQSVKEAIGDTDVSEWRIYVLTEEDHKTINIREAMKGENKEKWKQAYSVEFRKLLRLTDTKILMPNEYPYGHVARPMIIILEHKTDKGRRIRCVYNGAPVKNERRDEHYTIHSSDADTKRMSHAILATNSLLHGARRCTLDIGSFFLHHKNLLPRTAYFQFRAEYLPDEDKAEFASFVSDKGYILFQTGQTVYGMYDAGSISGNVLNRVFEAADYYQVDEQTCTWRSSRPDEVAVLFSVNVDDMDFQGVPGAGHRERFIKVLEAEGYVVSHTSFDEPTQHYCGYQYHHDFETHAVTMSAPGYVDAMLREYGMENVRIEKHPYKYVLPVWTKKQKPLDPDDAAILSPEKINELQKKIGKLMWYTNVCYEIATKVNKIASEQARPTQRLLDEANHIIAYLAGHKNTALVFRPSNMQLGTESDASFASERESKSRIGGVFLVGGYDKEGLPVNSPISIISKIADCHPDSAAEAEYVAVHDVVKKAVSFRRLLIASGFPQVKATENRSDNECAVKMTNGLVMDRKTKHIDRRYHWVRHKVKEGLFTVKWYKGSSNLADFFTKLLPPADHQKMTDIFTKQFNNINRKEGVLVGSYDRKDTYPVNPTY